MKLFFFLSLISFYKIQGNISNIVIRNIDAFSLFCFKVVIKMFPLLKQVSKTKSCLNFSVGTAGIILQAPSLYDLRPAIDEYLSEIEVAVAKPRGEI